MHRKLPKEVKPYAKSPVYTKKTVPEKLLNHHDLKAGTWGCLNVEEGKVDYFTNGQDVPVSTLAAGEKIVIQPEEKHYITPSEDARFFIEFYK